MKLDNGNVKKIRGLILFTVLILVGLWNYKAVLSVISFLWEVILPFILGGAIAFLMNIPMNFFEKKIFGKAKNKGKKWACRMARPVSLILTIVSICGVISIVILIVIPELGRTILNLGKTLQVVIPQIQAWVIDLLKEHKEIVDRISKMEFNWDSILQGLMAFLKSGTGSVIDTTVEAAKNIISGFATFFVGFAFACYILLQKEQLGQQVLKFMKAFMPEDWRNILLALAKITNRSFVNFITVQCLEAVILGMMFWVTMLILRLPYALLISVLIAFTALIPIFGAFIGCSVGVLLIFIVSPVKALIFVVVFLVLQQIEGNLIYPHVVGSSVGLPSIWVLVAVTLGGNLMGVVGMLIFIPMTSVVYTLLRGIVNRRLGLKE